MSTAEILRRSVLSHGLSADQIEVLTKLAHREGYAAGDSLTTLNDDDHDLYVLGDGRVQFLTQDGDLLGEAGPGGLVGEIAFVDGRMRTAHTVAVGFVDALRFPARELRSLMCSDKEIGFKLLANLTIVISGRLRTAIGQLDSLMDVQHDVWTHAL